jgi:hypothetical protein
MEQITIKRLTLVSALRIGSLLFFAVGLVLGIIALLVGVLGGGFHITVNTFEVGGPLAGIMGLIFLPVACGVVGFLAALITYLPLVVMSRTTNLMRVEGVFRREETAAGPEAAHEYAEPRE